MIAQLRFADPTQRRLWRRRAASWWRSAFAPTDNPTPRQRLDRVRPRVLGEIVACPWQARVVIGVADGLIYLDFSSPQGGSFLQRVVLTPSGVRRLAVAIRDRDMLAQDFHLAGPGGCGIIIHAPLPHDHPNMIAQRMMAADGSAWGMSGPPCCTLDAHARAEHRVLAGMQVGICDLGVTHTGLILHDDAGTREEVLTLLARAIDAAEISR